MELVRFGQSYKTKSQDEAYNVDNVDPAAKRVQIQFRSFGRGPERRSEFGVNLRWQDVEAVLKSFSDMGHPEAIKLRNALSLANAAEEVGWLASDKSASS
ncbi:hypothetical protein [Bradyrhizobium sp. S69]|uniref:hypothetical protein n=1 Tax=Bradyrhizobium sp. S69 TaxID=1641856 RepID=UPI00131E3A77|nr:hypothetical protein [Bradyrhizobium sp. S69]